MTSKQPSSKTKSIGLIVGSLVMLAAAIALNILLLFGPQAFRIPFSYGLQPDHYEQLAAQDRYGSFQEVYGQVKERYEEGAFTFAEARAELDRFIAASPGQAFEMQNHQVTLARKAANADRSRAVLFTLLTALVLVVLPWLFGFFFMLFRGK